MGKSDSPKSFVDAVHGHIYIPQKYCTNIIDTQLFQRLRRIEQTSMRPLFPCAHHDRFIHSLGTFHIGSRIIHFLKKNTEKDSELYDKIGRISLVNSITKGEADFWDSIQTVFELACLLHDCGHAPFSHTFEEYYHDRSCEESPIRRDIIKAYEEYVNLLEDIKSGRKKLIDEFKNDFNNVSPKPHELVSAWLVLHEKGFRDIIKKELNSDPALIARMIIGCKFTSSDINGLGFDKQIMNCFISLLNGHEIDADRLDYAIRDKWATGLNTISINIERLLSSIHIKEYTGNIPRNYIVCFGRKSLPELENLLDIKNYTSFWIFNHHKVLYHDRLLKKAVEKLALLFTGKESIEKYIQNKEEGKDDSSLEADGTENDALYNFFDYHSLIEPRRFEINLDDEIYIENLYLLCDDDIVYLLKKYFCVNRSFRSENLRKLYQRSNYAQEWFSRQYHLIPAWKSFAEFSSKYYSNHKDLQSVKIFLDLIKKLPQNKRSKIDNYKKLFLTDPYIPLYIKEVESTSGALSSINKIIGEIEQQGKHKNIFETIQGRLNDVREHYEEGIPKDFKDAFNRVLSKIKEEGRMLKPDTYKMITPDEVNMKEIKPNSIFVNLDGNIICYNKLNLPRKNENKAYNMFYMYLPRIYRSNNSEVELAEYNKFYTEEFQKEILRIQYKANN